MFHSIKDIKNPGQNFLSDVAPIDKKILSSKVSKQLKKIKDPVPRYFESLNQIQGYWSEGEYDLMEIFKLLKFEAWFFKSVQKKTSLLIKSGFSVRGDDDEINEYVESRFSYMELQTGESLNHIIEKIAYYLFICSNAFLIKVRDKDFQFGSSYTVDNKEMHPVVGLFLVHPTQLKPRFQWVAFPAGKQIKHKLALTKWVFVNRRGMITEFDPDDVVHFALHKEDGMIFGTPEVLPAIDDIRTLRKMEEDLGLLSYRDLFPLIHYTVESPSMIDHMGGVTEIDQAKRDMERMMQDGGIATDARHKINYIGSQGKHMELSPYLDYFRERVLSGLGVSGADLGIGKDISGSTAQSMSKQVIDAVRYVQQEITRQWDEKIVTEMMLQSPFGVRALKKGFKPTLSFEEIDIEWKIKTENHAADQFTKGIHTIDEVRNMRGLKTLDDAQLKRTQAHMYGDFSDPAIAAQKEIKSAAERDSVKSAKTNSNVTKSPRKKKVHDAADFLINDADLAMMYKETVVGLLDEHPTGKKFNLKSCTNDIYGRIKDRAASQVTNALQDAISALGKTIKIDSALIGKLQDSVFRSIDELCVDVTKKICDSNDYVNKAAIRIATADKTEQTKAYNLVYAAVCVDNGINNFLMVDYETGETRDVITFNTFDRTRIPPLHPNSKIILKADIQLKDEDDDILEDTASTSARKLPYDNTEMLDAMVSMNNSIDKKIAPILDYIEKLKSDTQSLATLQSSQLTHEDLETIQSGINDKLKEISNIASDQKEFNSSLATQHLNTIEAVIDSIKSMSRENSHSLRAMADAFPREITVNTAPMEVTVNTPPMEVNLTLDQKDQKATVKKKINIVRDAKGQMVSCDMEEE